MFVVFSGCLALGSSLEVCFQFPSHLLRLYFLKLFVISEAAVYFLLNYKAVVVKYFHKLGC